MHPRIRLFALAALASLAPVTGHAADAKASRFYEDALTRYEKRDVPGAIIQLKNAIKLDPTLLPVHVLLGQALLADGQAVAAEVAFQEALRLGVNRAEVVLPLARASIAQGKQRAVLEQAAMKPDGLPPDVRMPLLLLRAGAAADLGDARVAMLSIDEARAIDPSAPAVWLAEVPVRIRNRELDKANDAADKALSLAPKSADACYQKASVAHVGGDLGAALAGYDRALALEPGHVEARVARAGLLLDLARPADAAKDVAELRRVSPREPRGAYLRALLAERDGDSSTARSHLREVTALLDPVPVDFLRYRPQLLMLDGLAHYGLGEREKATPYLESLQRLQGQNPTSKLLAQIYLAEPNLERAIGVLTTYLRARPGDAQAMTLLASAYLASGRKAQASALMEESLRAQDLPASHTLLGLSLLGTERALQAPAELERAFSRDPTQTQAGTALVGIYLRRGQAAKALATAEALVAQPPANAALMNLLGLARVQAGDAGGARAAFEQALKLDDSLHTARLNLARLDMAAEAYDAAGKRIAEVLKATPKHAEAMTEMAALSLRRGQPAEAGRWLEKAVDAAGPREVGPGLALVNFHLRQGQNAPALEAAKQLAANAPDDLRALLASARAQLANADAAGARTSLTAATRVAGFNPAEQVRIAGLQMAADNLPGAAYSLGKALSASPDFLPALALNVDLQLRLGELEKAEQQARHIVAASPKRAIGHSLLGDVASARKQAGAAQEAYRRAHQVEPSSETLIRLVRTVAPSSGEGATVQETHAWLKAHPDDLAVRRELANLYARSGNFTAARAQYERLLQVAPEDADALNNLANLLLKSKDPGALATAEKALARDPGNAAVIDTVGWAAHQAGQSDRALQLLRDARLRDPASADIRYHLAVVLAKADRKAEARDELAVAMRSGQRLSDAPAADALAQTLR